LLRLIDPTRFDVELVAVGYAMLVALAGGLRILGVLLHDDAGPELADAVVELTAVGSRDVDDVVASVGRGGADASDPAIAWALVGVTELLEDNRALHGALEAQVEEVRQSRLRLLEAADLERRRLAARLGETAGRHLAELGTTVSVLKGTTGGDSADILDRVEEELAGTRDDLEQLARGVHPRLLVEEGLRASLLDLARRAAVPTDVSAPDQRFPAVVETTVWYVCAEAAVNVAKHADARTMSIAVALEADGVVATIADDGVGGARAGAGTGLAGLADRVHAVGGHLEVRSQPGRGTWLRAWVPVA
jgi:signal transduction histidine kinase